MQFSSSSSSKVSVAAAAASLALVATTASAQQSGGCGVYTIITTRGTDEAQGPSRAFTVAVRDTLAAVPGGAEYDTVYPADFFQQSEPGTLDILNKISTTLAQCPTHKFALLGYSQGATATTEALTRMTTNDAMFNAVSAVVMVGNPRHNKGLKSNVDLTGGKATEESYGLLSFQPAIPARWDDSGKVRDVCAVGDFACDAGAAQPVEDAHFSYINSTRVQSQNAAFMTDAFKAAAASTTASSSAASSTQTSSTSASASASTSSAGAPSGTGRPQSDGAMSLAGSAPALAVVAAAVSFGALLTIF